MKCKQGHSFDDTGTNCPDCAAETAEQAERERCYRLVGKAWESMGFGPGDDDDQAWIAFRDLLEAIGEPCNRCEKRLPKRKAVVMGNGTEVRMLCEDCFLEEGKPEAS